MHITDWFCTPWVNLLGQKSKSIVTENLIGHWDPSDPNSYAGNSGLDMYNYNNLVGIGTPFQGKKLNLFNGIETSWVDQTSLPASFSSDGMGDYMGPGFGYERDGFVIDTDKDFTLSMWIVPYSTSYESTNRWFASFGAINYEGIGLGSRGDGDYYGVGKYAVSYGSDQGFGMWMEEVIRGSKVIYNHPKDVNHNYFGFYDWQMLSLTKQEGRYGTGTDKLTLYINGMEDRLSASAGGFTPGGDAVENDVFGSDQALYVGGGMHTIMGYPDTSSNMFGIILVYDRALKPSELRQNFLATNISKKYRGATEGADHLYPPSWRDRGYFYY